MSKFDRFLNWLCYSKAGFALITAVSVPVALGTVYALFAVFAAVVGE